jgi:hypothetical protein
LDLDHSTKLSRVTSWRRGTVTGPPFAEVSGETYVAVRRPA